MVANDGALSFVQFLYHSVCVVNVADEISMRIDPPKNVSSGTLNLTQLQLQLVCYWAVI